MEIMALESLTGKKIEEIDSAVASLRARQTMSGVWIGKFRRSNSSEIQGISSFSKLFLSLDF